MLVALSYYELKRCIKPIEVITARAEELIADCNNGWIEYRPDRYLYRVIFRVAYKPKDDMKYGIKWVMVE